MESIQISYFHYDRKKKILTQETFFEFQCSNCVLKQDIYFLNALISSIINHRYQKNLSGLW